MSTEWLYVNAIIWGAAIGLGLPLAWSWWREHRGDKPMSREIVAAVLFIVLVAGFVVLDRTVLDPGGRGFGGEANDFCKAHRGVKEMNAQQGFVICWDGTAR